MKKKTIPYLFFQVYIAAALLLLVVALVPVISVWNCGVHRDESYVDLSKGWTDHTGNLVYLDELYENLSRNENTCEIYYDLPADLTEASQLCFRTRNTYVLLELDGKQIYQTNVEKHKFFNRSPGTNWNVVDLPEEAGGKQLKMTVYLAYADATSRIDQIYLGDGVDIMRDITGKKMLTLIVSVTMMIIGLVFIYADFPFNSGNKKNHSLLYLGCFAFMTGFWSVVETNLLQYYGSSGQVVQLAGDMLIKQLAIPILLFLAELYNRQKDPALLGICVLSLLDMFFSLVLHLTGIWDMHDSLIITHVVLALALICGAYVVFDEIRLEKGRTAKEKSEHYTVFHKVGILALAVAAFVDVIRYYVSPGTDVAFTIRIGLLAFIFCFGIGSMNRMIVMVKEGMQVEIIHKLAYSDAMTGIGNRAAYMKQIAEMNEMELKEQRKHGIVILDVNNLKKVNDSLGHHIGDEMLIRAADIIEKSFGACGNVFRIGGDEFAVIIWAPRPREAYESAVTQFLGAVADYNSKPEKKYGLSIAYGYAEPDAELNEERVDFEKLQSVADEMMYQEKKRMKQGMTENSDSE